MTQPKQSTNSINATFYLHRTFNVVSWIKSFSPACWSAVASCAHPVGYHWQQQIPNADSAEFPGLWCLRLLPVSLEREKKRIIGISFCYKKQIEEYCVLLMSGWHYLRSSMTLACSLSSLISTKRLENFRPRASVIWLLMTACLRRSTDSYERENNCQNNTFKIWDSLRGGRYDKIWNFLMVWVIKNAHQGCFFLTKNTIQTVNIITI